MKSFALIALMALISANSFATTTLTCKSANYAVQVSDIEEYSFANYSVNGKLNDGADVELDKSYLSDRAIALGLTVDGQKNKIEISVAKNSKGVLAGTLFFGKTSQAVTCKRL